VGAKPVGHSYYFGIKMAPRHTMCCTVTTHEVVDGERVKMDLVFAILDHPSGGWNVFVAFAGLFFVPEVRL
jgi:hypothetical protein